MGKSGVGAIGALLQRALQTENLVWALGGKDIAKKEVCVLVCVIARFFCCSQVPRVAHFSGTRKWDSAKGGRAEPAVCRYLGSPLLGICTTLECLEGAEQYDTQL